MKFCFKLLSILLSLSLLSCSDKDKIVELQSLRLNPRTATINIGSTQQFTAESAPHYDNLELSWSSENSAIATVDDNGLVTAISVGTTQIICTYFDQKIARAAIQVVDPNSKPEQDKEDEKEDDKEDENGDNKDDQPEEQPNQDYNSTNISNASLSAKLSESLIFSSRQLRYPGTVMQGFDFYDPSEDGYIYFAQCGVDSSTGNKWLGVISRVKRGPYGDTTRSGDAMFLRWFGHCTNMSIEQATDGGEDFVWINSNSTLSGTTYGSNKTFCRLRFEPNKTLEHYAGENFYLDKYKDKNGKTYTTKEVHPSIDFKYRRMLISCLVSGSRHLIVYDLDQVLALKEKSITLTRTWGGETNTNTTKTTGTTTLMARDLGELTPISSFIITNATSSKDYTRTWSLAYQGHAIFNDLIFWWEGEGIEGTSGSGIYDKSCAYLEVFDFNGKRVLPRTKVAAASDFAAMKNLVELNDNCYSEAEGVQCRHGKLYLGITTHMAGATTGNRRSTILEYDIRK